MEAWKRNAYVEMLHALQAERQLLAIEAACFPHMKPDGQRETRTKYGGKSGAAQAGRAHRPSLAEIAAMGIPVRIHEVKKDEAPDVGRTESRESVTRP